MRTRLMVFVILVLVMVSVGVTLFSVRVLNAQNTYVTPEKLRFRLVGDEPVAGPDGRNTVAGMKVLVLKDMQSGQCHIVFLNGTAMSATAASVCP